MSPTETPLAPQPDRSTAKSAAAVSAEPLILAPVHVPLVRPFHFHAPEEDLVELKRRIEATRWPERELVNDGVKACTSADAEARDIGQPTTTGAGAKPS